MVGGWEQGEGKKTGGVGMRSISNASTLSVISETIILQREE